MLEVNKGFYNLATGEITIVFCTSSSRPSDYAIGIVPAAYRPRTTAKGICSIAISGGGATTGPCEVSTSTGQVKHYLTNQATSYVTGLVKYKL